MLTHVEELRVSEGQPRPIPRGGAQALPDFSSYRYAHTVWLGGRVVGTLDLRSVGREFKSWPLRYRVQPWASC